VKLELCGRIQNEKILFLQAKLCSSSALLNESVFCMSGCYDSLL